jgi:hypothetical protein
MAAAGGHGPRATCARITAGRGASRGPHSDPLFGAGLVGLLVLSVVADAAFIGPGLTLGTYLF